MDWLLDDPELFKIVHQDFKRHYARSSVGRPSVAVEVTLRMSVLRRRKKWSYRQAQQEVQDSPAYRGWVRVYDQAVPDYSTLNELERVVRPHSLHQMNDRLMRLAQERRITQGYRLRVDSSVTESHIHYPTDSSLLVDGVRVLSRLLERAQPYLRGRLQRSAVCRNRTRSARRRARHIAQLSRPPRSTARRSQKR